MEAADLPPDGRGDFLNSSCGNDKAIREEIESLLAALGEAKTDAPPHDDLVDATRIGRYLILEKVGEGGMGAVYKARQEHPVRRTVALKLIKLGMDTKQVIARFEAERQALAMMDHPNIARVLDAGASDAGRPYFVMDLIRGIPITEYCDRERLTIRSRLELFIRVCQAVQHAHTKGIIHRDLKPSNILVAVNDGAPVPKVIDFGIAKAAQGRLTDYTVATGQRQWLGTPQYMSPEQAEGGGDIDTRSDIYSLGVILYELLTGTTPLDWQAMNGPGAEQILRRIREAPPRKPSARLTSVASPEAGQLQQAARSRGCEPSQMQRLVRGDLDWIVLKAIDQDCDRRYQTAGALAADIQRHLDNEPVLARPPTAGYRLSRFVRRHRLGMAASVAVGSALVVGIVGLSVGLVRAHGAQLAAQSQARKAEAVSNFMRGILAAARPGGGGEPRVLDLLKEASTRIDHDLRDQPEAEIEARQTLADTYHILGHSAEAEPQASRAYALSVQLDHGTVSPRTLRLATKLVRQWITLKDWHDPSTEQLARRTYDAARRTLGESHPITQVAAHALATALTFNGRPGEAEQIARRLLIQKIDQMPDYSSDPSFFAGKRLGLLAWALHNQGKSDDGVIEELRGAVRRMKAEALPDPFCLPDAQIALGVLLADRGIEKDALEQLRLGMMESRRQCGILNSYTQWATFEYAGALQRAAQSDAAINLLNEHLALIRSQQPQESQVLAYALIHAGMAQVDRHEKQGIPLALEGFTMTSRVGAHPDSDQAISYRDALRSALLAKLGSWDHAPEGKLPAQIYCATDEMFLDNQSRLLDFATMNVTDVNFQVRPWGDKVRGAQQCGTLDALSPSGEPPPGLYAITVKMPGSAAGRLEQTQWLLVAPWKVDIYYSDRRTLLPLNLRPGYYGDLDFESAPWEKRLTESTAASTQTVNCLAFMASLKASPAPDGRGEDFGIVARTSVKLPAGRYRFIVTSDDGARLYVDRRRLIDAWVPHFARRDTADVQLDAGRHDLKVEYFQAGGSYKLWVRIEPLDAPTPIDATPRVRS